MSTHNQCFEQKYEKYSFLFENFQFLEEKFSIYLNRCVFVISASVHSDLGFLFIDIYYRFCKGAMKAQISLCKCIV